MTGTAAVHADPPPPPEVAPPPRALTREEALQWTLQYNPALATQRQQHGIAAAAVVIARTYPFNPLWQAFVWYDNGRDVTNHVFEEHTMRLDLELRGQGKHRREAALAGLSRTDWEIAGAELPAAVRALRAFDAVLYRQEKLRLLEEIAGLLDKNATQVRQMFEQARASGADQILAQAEARTAHAQRGPGQVALAAAQQELLRAVGMVNVPLIAHGTLDTVVAEGDPSAFSQMAFEHRPEIHARRLAIAEADARIRLEIANRFGNPSFGPAFEYNEARDYFVGGWLVTPVPLINTRRGEIMQRKAERERALLDLNQIEVQVRQDVSAALARLHEAQAWIQTYAQLLPSLRNGLEEMEKLFINGQQGADLVRVNDVRRRLLTARDAYLDAQWELRQAEIDLAAAIGDPSLALCPALAPKELPSKELVGRVATVPARPD